MKKSKLLAPALALLCLSTAASAAGTVAWFSANYTINVTSVNISAQSDATDLQISKTGADESWTNAIDDHTTNMHLLPVAHEASGYYTGIELTNTGWYYGYSNADDVSTIVQTTKTNLTAQDTLIGEGKYLYRADYYFRLAEDTNNKGTNLRLSAVTLPKGTIGNQSNQYLGITVLALGADGHVEYATDFEETEQNAGVTLVTDVYNTPASANAQRVSVYFYIDGNHASVTTENIDALVGSISLTFKITPAAKTQA